MELNKFNVDQINNTFISEDKNVQRKLTLLGHSLTQAVVEDESKLAETVIKEAKRLIKDAERV